jgi:DNA-binding MarR family transcriptional regulator
MANEPTDVSSHTGAMLRMVSQWVRDEVHRGVVADGYMDLNPAHIWVFRYPGPEGMRPSELAVDLQVSKQSVNDLLADLEHRGYLVREPDPADGRARFIRLTPQGCKLATSFARHARSAELRMAAILGAQRYGQLRSILGDLCSALPEVGAFSLAEGATAPDPDDRALGLRDHVMSAAW